MASTWLHEMEFRNAIRLQAFRKQLDPSDVAAILHKQALGLENGLYFPALPALAEVNREAAAEHPALQINFRLPN